MSSRRSSRTRRRRCRFFQAFVRSTTQRCRPSRCFDSIPGRAMRGVMPRRRSSWRLTVHRIGLFEEEPGTT